MNVLTGGEQMEQVNSMQKQERRNNKLVTGQQRNNDQDTTIVQSKEKQHKSSTKCTRHIRVLQVGHFLERSLKDLERD